MAMACFRLLTVPPLPPFPLFKAPRLNLRISRSTSLEALFEYFRAMRLLHAGRARASAIEAVRSISSFERTWLPLRLPYVRAVLHSALPSWPPSGRDRHPSPER